MSDFRYALRVLLARPGFSVVNAVLLRPLPFQQPDRLMLIVERNGPFLSTLTTSWQNYTDWRDQSRSFEHFGAFRNLTMTLAGGSEPERVPAKMISAAVLPGLGVAPAIGRAFM